MRKYSNDPQDARQIGNTFLIYGKPGVGKTASLVTLPDPLLVIVTEPRDPRRSMSFHPDFKSKKIEYVECDSFDEYIEFLDSLYRRYLGGEKPYNSVCFDSLSFGQSKFRIDLEDSRFEKEVKLVKHTSKNRFDTLVDRFRIEVGDWGSLNSMMKRLTWLLNRISKFGVNVVATSTAIEYPSWNKDLELAPAFQGAEFSSVVTGYFDFIGLVVPNAPSPYPPIVNFVSDGSFIAKSCSAKINEKGGKGILDFSKILEVIKEG